MKIALGIFFLHISLLCWSQEQRISTIDFVEVLNGNKDEARFYYENNWKVLREKAVERGYIDSYEMMEAPKDVTYSFTYMLMTTYKDSLQYQKREEHFAEIIEEQGELKLLNQLKPGDFRKSVFATEKVRHLN